MGGLEEINRFGRETWVSVIVSCSRSYSVLLTLLRVKVVSVYCVVFASLLRLTASGLRLLSFGGKLRCRHRCSRLGARRRFRPEG